MAGLARVEDGRNEEREGFIVGGGNSVDSRRAWAMNIEGSGAASPEAGFASRSRTQLGNAVTKMMPRLRGDRSHNHPEVLEWENPDEDDLGGDGSE